jgi:hypothetical protein
MPLPRDDSGGNRKYRQVARRFVESEVLAQRQELIERRAESQRLRAALEHIAEAEPQSHDLAGLRSLIDSLRSIAHEALLPVHETASG